MNKQTDFNTLIEEIRISHTKEQIEYACKAFCQYADFDNYLVFGSVFSSLMTSTKCILGNFDKSVRNQAKQIENITRACMNQPVPIVTGKYNSGSPLNNSLINPLHTPSIKGISVSFPVHFPIGKFACLYISTNETNTKCEDQVMNILAPGNQFAREAGNAIFRLLEVGPDSEPPYLSAREKQCLLLATDGLTPPQIAEKVGLSAHTVIFHLKKAREKLESKNIQGAVSKAILRGDIETNI